MPRWVYYITGLVLALVVVVAAAHMSVQSATCMLCHQQEASYTRWMASRLKAEKKGFSHELIACADCHMEGSPAGTFASKLRGLLHAVTYFVPQLDPRRPRVSGLFTETRVPRENCQYCHLASLWRKEVQLLDLTPELKKIGLVMDHRKHVVAHDDTCAKCHERYKANGEADRMVTYTEVNHLACDSCHTRASHLYRAEHLLPMTEKQYVASRDKAWDQLAKNPRWLVALPTEKSCRRCHNGQIHFKTKIFLADCRTGKDFNNCVKCHSIMTREYFDQYLKERDRTAAVPKTNDERSPGQAAGTHDNASDGRMASWTADPQQSARKSVP